MHVWMKDIWKKPFSRVLSHDLHGENKTYTLKGSVSILLSVSSIFGGGRCLLTLPTLYRVRAYSRRALMNGWALYRVNSYTVVGEKKGEWPFFTWSGSQKIRFWMRSVEDSYNVLSCCIARYRQTDNLCQGAEHHKHENLVSILSPEIFLAGTDPGGMDWVASQPPLE